MTLKFTVLTLLVGATLVGCSGASTSSPSPTPSSPSAGTISTAFLNKCANCHGKDGTTKQGGSALKGSATAQAAWQSAIRNGIGSMTAVSGTDYPDSSMQADYKVLTGKTWK